MRDLPGWLILVAGLLYLGGAAMTALQTVHAVLLTGYSSEVLLTLAFIAGPLLLGIYAVYLGVRAPGTDPSLRRGVAMILVGLLGLLLWAGLLIGPVLAIAGGVLVLVQHYRRPSPGLMWAGLPRKSGRIPVFHSPHGDWHRFGCVSTRRIDVADAVRLFTPLR